MTSSAPRPSRTIRTIDELPFRERPTLELLGFAADRAEPDPDHGEFGWARVPRVWLKEPGAPARPVDDVLLVALHCADDAEVFADDIELYFEVPDRAPVTALASSFLARWLPRIAEGASSIVLALCNPHEASIAPPKGTTVPVYFALGEVASWQSRDDGRIELRAPHWRRTMEEERSTVSDPTMSDPFERRPGAAIDDDTKQTYVGLWLLKKLDLPREDGGMDFPVSLPAELSPLDEPLQRLAVEDLVRINTKTGRYDLTDSGIAYLGRVIDEASDLVDDLDDLETHEAIAELRNRGLDVFRARFLWGWFSGEFDDVVQWQEQRGVRPVERLWAFYLTGDELWSELARELEAYGS